MKYLIPIDFSDYGEYAFQMGIKMSKITKAEIHLFHSIEYTFNYNKINLGKIKNTDLKMHVKNWAKKTGIDATRCIKSRFGMFHSPGGRKLY